MRLPIPKDPPPVFFRAHGGRVVVTDVAKEKIAAGPLSLDDASAMMRELLHAVGDAHRAAAEARGENQWVALPLQGGGFSVAYRGATARFRPILNSKRPRRREGRGHDCTVCRREIPVGATMYVWTGEQPHTFHAGDIFRGHRACETCMRPELQAALVGAALLGKAES